MDTLDWIAVRVFITGLVAVVAQMSFYSYEWTYR
jgi:hypothetical protein